jgi:stage II sporulation protein AA (anti-sigma F factor antagonist)
MEAILNKSKKCLIVRLKGELDDHMAANLRQTLKDILKKNPGYSLLMNLQDLSFIDSSGVGVILGRYRDMEQGEREIMLCGLNSQVRRVLDLAGVLKIIPNYDTEKEALNQGRFTK